ncbi:MAG: hypothetical protein AVDCRST_MAG77-4958, partial [uncultured Chloroflexi bacterium]
CRTVARSRRLGAGSGTSGCTPSSARRGGSTWRRRRAAPTATNCAACGSGCRHGGTSWRRGGAGMIPPRRFLPRRSRL